MNRLESELFDLEELLMRNDGMADDGTYSTIVGIANDVSELEEENAKLRNALKALMIGTNAELCADRDYPNCEECSMHRDRVSCTVTDAMWLLGCDAYGEPIEVEDK